VLCINYAIDYRPKNSVSICHKLCMVIFPGGDIPYQLPYNLSRSASKERAHCGSLWLLSVHCVWPSVSWKSIINESSSCILASQNITQSAPPTQSALPPVPTRLVTKNTPLPLGQKVQGIHSPLWIESRVECFLCRCRRSQSDSGEDMKTMVNVEECNATLCFTPKWSCFHEFHYM